MVFTSCSQAARRSEANCRTRSASPPGNSKNGSLGMARASRFPAKWSNNCRDGKNGPIGIIRSSSFWLRFDASAESADCCDRWCVDFAESVLIPGIVAILGLACSRRSASGWRLSRSPPGVILIIVHHRLSRSQANFGFFAALASVVLLQRGPCLRTHDAIECPGIEPSIA